jgi:hypothetical protein
LKLRTGFVSNSSSSSFLIYGITASDRDLPKEVLPRDSEGEPDTRADTYDIWDKFISDNGLDHWHPSYDITHYIGLSWDRVKDDETGKQFKERAEALIEKAFGKKMKLTTLEEAWRDG